MSMRRLPLVATLSTLSVMAMAADYNGGVQDVVPGRILDAGRRVFLTGLVDIDALKETNTTDGNSSRSDMRSEGWGRAELGSRIVLEDRLEVGVTMGYVSQAGNNRPIGYDINSPPATGTANSPEANANNGYHSSGDLVLEDAFIHLPNFLGMRELSLLAGRQQVAFNLRKGRPAWLFDSRSQNLPVTRWDGAQVKYDLDAFGADVNAFAFRLPDDSSMFGGMADWKVIDKGDVQLFLTGSYNYQASPRVWKDPSNTGTYANTTTGTSSPGMITADNLSTTYVGLDLDMGTVEFYGELAMQRGDMGDTAGTTLGGWGMNAGMDWHMIKDSSQDWLLGAQYELLSGDDGKNRGQYNGFVNTWEATSDTYLFEHEKYGQISRLLVGNLSDWKVRMDYSVLKKIRMGAIWGRYDMDTAPSGVSNNLGNEIDLTFSWDYAGSTASTGLAGGCTFTLFGGMFKPSSGYEDLQNYRNTASDGTKIDPNFTPGTDMMWQMGVNILARF